MQITLTEIACVILGGIALSGVTLAYRQGQARGVPIALVGLFVLITAGSFFFVRTDWRQIMTCPPHIVLIGIACGTSQYLLFRMMVAALHRGPLSPVNCAVFLSFVLVIVYAYLALGEAVHLLQACGVAASILCVFFAAFQTGKGKKPDGRSHSARDWILYGLILFSIFVLGAITNGSFKYMSSMPEPGEHSYMKQYQLLVVSLLYLGLILGLGVQLLFQLPTRAMLRRAVLPGVIGGCASAVGLTIASTFSYLPAAFNLPVSAITSILFGAVISVIWFGEKTSLSWWGMMTSGVATAALLILDACGVAR